MNIILVYLPNSLLRSERVATAALNMFTNCLLVCPRQAPYLTLALHKLPLPFMYASNNTIMIYDITLQNDITIVIKYVTFFSNSEELK